MTAVDGLAGMHPETQVQTLAGAGVEPVNIVCGVDISCSVPVGDRPGWSGLDAGLIRGDTVTVAALDRISRNRVELAAVVESLHRLGVGIASLALAESWLQPLGAHPTEVEQMMGKIILRVMAGSSTAISLAGPVASKLRRFVRDPPKPPAPGSFGSLPDDLDALECISILWRVGGTLLK